MSQSVEQKLRKNLSKARRILEMAKDQLPEELIKQTLLSDIEIVSANDLLKQIQSLHGIEVGQQFIELVTQHQLPSNKQPLLQFFAGRKDLISQNCVAQLGAN